MCKIYIIILSVNIKTQTYMEPNNLNNDQIVTKVQEVIQEPILNDEAMEDEGLLSKKNLILALLLFLFILFFSILAYSAKYYFDNQNQRPATVQSIPQPTSASSSTTSSTASSATTSASSAAPKVIEPKPGVINSDGGLLIRKDDGSLKYPNPTGPVQGSFTDKEEIKIDTTKGKKEFTIGIEKLTFVYGTGTNKDGWIAEKYIVYR
jgi:cytoskeletal protein RodZ